MPEQVAAEGHLQTVSRLLFSPLFLIYEIVAVLMPGTLFGVLLLAKRNSVVMAAAGSTILGYRTKLCLAVFLCYLVGRAFKLPIEIAYQFLSTRVTELGASAAPDMLKRMLIGSAVLPGLFGKALPADYIGLAYTNLSFCFNTGLVLSVSSAIPGDHYLRLVELIVGLLMLLSGALQVRPFVQSAVAWLGASTNLTALFGPIASAVAAIDKLKDQAHLGPEPPQT